MNDTLAIRRLTNKFRNTPQFVDGHRFASRKEAKRYAELQLLVRAKQIEHLTLQPRYPLAVHDRLICTYVGDFEYVERGKRICEDTKGFRTPDYIIKRKLFMALYPDIEHREL